MKEVSERTERPVDTKTDAWKGNDVFFIFSNQITGAIIQDLDFNPRNKGYEVDRSGKKTVFVKSFPVLNFSGVPTIVIATTLDVTEAFGEAFQSVAIRTGIIFLVISIVGVFGTLKFGQIRSRLTGALDSQKQELEERSAACDIAVGRLREVDLIKRGFFTNLVAAVNDPLQAVSGQLQSVTKTVETIANGVTPELDQRQILRDRFSFALDEITRLGRLVSDYQQLELFRQTLDKTETPPIALSDVINSALASDLTSFKRLPQLSIVSNPNFPLRRVRGAKVRAGFGRGLIMG